MGDGQHDMYSQVIVISVVGEFIYQGILLIAIIFDDSSIVDQE